jgi:hypothetical protein
MPRIAVAATTAYVGLCLAVPAGATADPGGAPASPAPKLTSVACKTDCSGVAYARTGSVLVLKGRDLDTAETITFLGSPRPGDEVSVEPERVSAKSVTVRVPRKAPKRGPLSVTNGDGAVSKPSARAISVENVKTRRVDKGGAGPGLEMAVSGKKVFFDGERRPTLSYVVRDSQPVKVVVEVVRSADAVSVARAELGLVPPNEQRTFSWDGLGADGAVVPDGRYEFRVYAENAAGVRASSAQADPQAPETSAPSPDSFMLLGHKFPIRGAHDYGEFAASYGGGRDHKGQDVFAKCGTPLVAARGGTVKIKQFQARAGHYLVIDGDHTDVDYIYMHLREAALVEKGARVHTGQLIGYVGDTGRASGCHLHFEMWSGPGWYTGGSPFDPLPHLKAWDKFS